MCYLFYRDGVNYKRRELRGRLRGKKDKDELKKNGHGKRKKRGKDKTTERYSERNDNEVKQIGP